MITKLVHQLKEELAELECGFGQDLQIAEKLVMLGDLFCSELLYPNAERCYWRALELRQRHLGPVHITVASSLLPLAQCYELQGQNPKADALYDAMIGILQDLPGGEAPAAVKVIEHTIGFYSSHKLTTPVACLTELKQKFAATDLAYCKSA